MTMEPEDHFRLLGLDPATCQEADLKAAYTRLVKERRPDRDPAGYRSIREAYEFCRSPKGAWVMAQARSRGPGVDQTDSPLIHAGIGTADPLPDLPAPHGLPPLPDPTSWSVPPVPPPAVRIPPQQDLKPAAGLPLLPEARPLQELPTRPAPSPEPGKEAVEAVLTQWEAGVPDPLEAALARWSGDGHWPALIRLGQRWRQVLASCSRPGTCETAMRLAFLLALVDAKLARSLADDAGRLTAGRHLGSADLDARLHLGRHFLGLPQPLRFTLGTILDCSGSHLIDESFVQELRSALSSLPYDAMVIEALAERIPGLAPRSAPGPEIPPQRDPKPVSNLPRAPEAKGSWFSFSSTSSQDTDGSSKLTFSQWLIILIFLGLVSGAIRGANRSFRSRSPDWNDPQPTQPIVIQPAIYPMPAQPQGQRPDFGSPGYQPGFGPYPSDPGTSWDRRREPGRPGGWSPSNRERPHAPQWPPSSPQSAPAPAPAPPGPSFRDQ